MVELTFGGAWLKWDSLTRQDRNWALLSLATSTLAAIPTAVICGDWAYKLGFRAGSGGRDAPDTGVSRLLASDLFAYATLTSVVLTIVSGLAWWRLSRNQDEMFNRIQNYAIGQAGAWTFSAAFVWWLLALGGWAGPLPLAGLVALGTALLLAFWFQAVRRWG